MAVSLPPREPVKLIADVIESELGLASGQVMVTNQKYNIPKTPGLYVVVRYLAGKAIANNNYGNEEATAQDEVQELVMQEMVRSI